MYKSICSLVYILNCIYLHCISNFLAVNPTEVLTVAANPTIFSLSAKPTASNSTGPTMGRCADEFTVFFEISKEKNSSV